MTSVCIHINEKHILSLIHTMMVQKDGLVSLYVTIKNIGQQNARRCFLCMCAIYV